MSDTTTADAAAQTPQAEPPAGAARSAEPASFRSRGSARRRARYLRKARELSYRDLGGLVFNLHRFGQRNDALVLAKLTALSQIDTQLRTLEGVLGERRPVTVLREAGITACPRCAAIHSSEDNFCPNCGFSISHHADLPIAAPAPAANAAAASASAQVATNAPAAVSAQAAAPAAASGAPAAAVPATVPTPAQTPVAANKPPSTPSSDAPSTPSTRASTPPGRSPSPPSSASTAPSAPPSTSSSPPAPSDEDGPTEIISPPLPGS